MKYYTDKNTNNIRIKNDNKYLSLVDNGRRKKRELDRSLKSFENKISKYIDLDIWHSIDKEEKRRIHNAWIWSNKTNIKIFILSYISEVEFDKSIFRERRINKLLN